MATRLTTTILGAWFSEDNGYKLLWALGICTLLIIVVSTLLFWPVPVLGWEEAGAQTPTGVLRRVISVEQGSAAAAAGLRVGDLVERDSGATITETYHPSFATFRTPGATTELVIRRNGQPQRILIPNPQPSGEAQKNKVLLLVLALLCWFTGAVLAFVRRTSLPFSSILGSFWMLWGAIIGALDFVNRCFPLLLVLLVWIVVCVQLPAQGAVHLLYPPRISPLKDNRRVWWLLLVVLLGLNIIALLAVQASRIHYALLVDSLLLLFPWMMLGALVTTIILLIRLYRQSNHAHTRRQIRLIVAACAAVLLIRLIVRSLPPFSPVPTGTENVGEYWVDFLFGLIPLAYLLGGYKTDLYLIDRVAVRAMMILTASAVLVSSATLAQTYLSFDRSPTSTVLLSVAVLVLLRPTYQLIERCTPHWWKQRQRDQVLDQLNAKLTKVLDAKAIADTLALDVSTAFGVTAHAIWITRSDETELEQHRTHHLANVPQSIDVNLLAPCLGDKPRVLEPSELRRAIADVHLDDAVYALVFHPSIALWCTMGHQGSLLGLLALGTRDTFDPYRSTEKRYLLQTTTTATLALAHSMAFRQQQLAAELVEQLYLQLQQEKDNTARELASELHDLIINGQVRLSIELLYGAIARVRESALRDDLQEILENEQTLLGALRQICQRLYPPGIGDPFGLAGALRLEMHRVQRQIGVKSVLEVHGTPLPIPRLVQHEALRIVREALLNVDKHADASKVVIRIVYANEPQNELHIEIIDNGRSGNVARIRSGHVGLVGMQLNAAAVGGSLSVNTIVGTGTTVRFTTPLPFMSPADALSTPAPLDSGHTSDNNSPTSASVQNARRDAPLLPNTAQPIRPSTG